MDNIKNKYKHIRECPTAEEREAFMVEALNSLSEVKLDGRTMQKMLKKMRKEETMKWRYEMIKDCTIEWLLTKGCEEEMGEAIEMLSSRLNELCPYYRKNVNSVYSVLCDAATFPPPSMPSKKL